MYNSFVVLWKLHILHYGRHERPPCVNVGWTITDYVVLGSITLTLEKLTTECRITGLDTMPLLALGIP